jgi:hypothetical protein
VAAKPNAIIRGQCSLPRVNRAKNAAETAKLAAVAIDKKIDSSIFCLK